MKTPKKIDLEQVEDMAAEFCTQDEIAEDMGFNRSLFTRRKDVRTAFLRGNNAARTSLRHMMFNSAKSGDRAVMIFLAKNELGYRDNPIPVTIENEREGKLADLINGLKEDDLYTETAPPDGDVAEEQAETNQPT